MKLRSIRTRLLIYVIVTVVLVAASLSCIGILKFKSYEDQNTHKDLQIDLKGFESKLDGLKTNALGNAALFALNPNVAQAIASKDTDQILSTLKPLVDKSQLDFVTVCDAKGVVLARTHEPEKKGDSVANQANVQAALSGKTAAYIEKGTQVKLSARAASPVYGANGELVGAVSVGFSLDSPELVDSMKETFSSDYTVFLADERINTTISKDGKRILGTKLNPAITEIVLTKGQSYSGKAEIEGTPYVTAYEPIIGPDGKPLGVLFAGQGQTEVNRFLFNYIYTILLVALGVLIIAALIGYFYLGSSINQPVKEILSVTNKVAEGNLNAKINYRSNNEFGLLADGIMKTVRFMQSYITNISDTLGKMAKGDLSVSIDMEYIGDFAQIKTSMVEITDSLNDMLLQINQASSQVLSGAGQMSAASLALSQGTTEQASTIEELSATIENVSAQIRKNADNALNARTISAEAQSIMEQESAHMQEMVSAMEDINQTSQRISKIIKTIDEIAFQTNILALNAAVEAARAGEAGKGFAVVADEVRNLASKSAEAAKDTTILIENSIQAVGNGRKIANETAKFLDQIVVSSHQSTELINLISQASSHQAMEIAQITQAVSQISSVVQTNSATAEESAAASEELSGQADMLNQLVSKFRLRQEGRYEPKIKIGRSKHSAEKLELPKSRGKY